MHDQWHKLTQSIVQKTLDYSGILYLLLLELCSMDPRAVPHPQPLETTLHHIIL